MRSAKWRDIAQNILITLLALSAVFLFSQTQFFRLGATAGKNYFSTAPNVSELLNGASSAEALSAPVRMVITDAYRHTGSLELTTVDESFLPIRDFLDEVLGSAHAPVPSNRETFFTALKQPSVFYDFLHRLPLSHIASQCSASISFDAECQYLLISQQIDGIHLFLWDGADTFLRCATALQSSNLPVLQETSDFGSFFFAEEIENGQHLIPCTLLPETQAVRPQLSVGSAIQNMDRVLSAFQFNPHTNSRYTESSGTEVIIDGDRALRLQPNGTILYQSGGSQNLLRIPSASDTPTMAELTSGVYAFLCSAASFGDAQLYVDSVAYAGDKTVVSFSYHMHGTPIRLSDSAHAATVILSGNTISSLTFYPRQYTAAEELAQLLPVTQAVAVSAVQNASTLSIGYADRGGSNAQFTWLIDF